MGPLEGRCQGGIGSVRDFLEEMPVKDKRGSRRRLCRSDSCKRRSRRSLGLQHSPEEGSSRPLERPRACWIEESQVSAGLRHAQALLRVARNSLPSLDLMIAVSSQSPRKLRGASPWLSSPICACSEFVSLYKAKPHPSVHSGTKERPMPLWRWWFTWPPSMCLQIADTSSGWRGMEPDPGHMHDKSPPLFPLTLLSAAFPYTPA